MKKISFSIIAFCLMLCVGTNPLFSQDEEAAASDTTAVEDLEDEIDEAFLEEEEAEEEYVDSSPAFEGLTVGLNIGFPVITGQYLKGATSTGPNIGIIVGTPYGLPLGPFDLGIGAEILTYSWGDYYSGMAILGTINTTLNNVLPFLPGNVSAQIGGGYFGAGVGTTAGVAYDIELPNIPVAIKVYDRLNVTSAAGGDDPYNKDQPTMWINIGAIVTYDISTLF
jgi:hypothetical protein